jgi:hypothetical protein
MNIEPCSVCFSDYYIQNTHFLCSHPLCTSCFIKLRTNHCPLCRSTQTHPILKIEINNYRNRYISIQILTKFVINDRDYKTKMNRFLRERVKKDFIKRVNNYRPFNRFILVKGQYLSISDMSNAELTNYVLNNSISNKNKIIIYNEIYTRQSIFIK